MLEVAGATTVASRKAMIENAADLASRWPALPASEKRAILLAAPADNGTTGNPIGDFGPTGARAVALGRSLER